MVAEGSLEWLGLVNLDRNYPLPTGMEEKLLLHLRILLGAVKKRDAVLGVIPLG